MLLRLNLQVKIIDFHNNNQDVKQDVSCEQAARKGKKKDLNSFRVEAGIKFYDVR